MDIFVISVEATTQGWAVLEGKGDIPAAKNSNRPM
jgi:hypothetical protein